jgi:hypothetical protein
LCVRALDRGRVFVRALASVLIAALNMWSPSAEQRGSSRNAAWRRSIISITADTVKERGWWIGNNTGTYIIILTIEDNSTNWVQFVFCFCKKKMKDWGRELVYVCRCVCV